jgi:hypothetical protein
MFEPHILVFHGPNHTILARLDLERGEIATTATCPWLSDLVACEGADTVLVREDHERIVRLRFGTDERTLVFPR